MHTSNFPQQYIFNFLKNTSDELLRKKSQQLGKGKSILDFN